MSRKKVTRIVFIENPHPGGKKYTTAKCAADYVGRGWACWIGPDRIKFIECPARNRQAARVEQARDAGQNCCKGSDFQYRESLPAGSKVMMLKRVAGVFPDMDEHTLAGPHLLDVLKRSIGPVEMRRLDGRPHRLLMTAEALALAREGHYVGVGNSRQIRYLLPVAGIQEGRIPSALSWHVPWRAVQFFRDAPKPDTIRRANGADRPISPPLER